MRLVISIVMASALASGSIACGVEVPGESQPATLPPDSLSEAEEILALTRAAMAEVQSYQFVFEIAAEQPPHSIFPSLERTGAWEAPDRWLLAVEGEDTMLVIGEDLYFRTTQGSADRPWRGIGIASQYPGFVPHGPFLHLTAPDLLDQGMVDGEMAYRIAGQSKHDDPEVRFGAVTQIELFIRQLDNLPVRMVIKDFSRSVEPGPDGTAVPISPRPQDAAIFSYHSFNVPVGIEAPYEWETGPAPTATPGQAYRATLGFGLEPAGLTEAEWRELAAALDEFLRNAGHAADVRLVDGMVMVDVAYTRERAEELTISILEAPLPFPLKLRAEGYGTRGSP